MSKEKLNNLIDKVVGKVGLLRVPAYWMNKLFKDIGERISATEESIAEVDSKVDETKASIPTKVSQLENDAELASKYSLPHWRDVSFDQEGESISLAPFSVSVYKGYFGSGYLRPDNTTDGTRYEFLCVLDEDSVLGYYSGDYPPLASKELTLGVYKITLEFIDNDCVFHHLEKLDTVGGVSLLTYRNSEDNPTILLDRYSGDGLYYKGRKLHGNGHDPDGFGEHVYVNFGKQRDFSVVNQLIRVKSSNRVIKYEFKGMKNLLDVDFRELEEMYISSFEGCSGLQTANLGAKLKDINARAFYGCSSLTSVAIPDSVTTIGDDAFKGCSSLTSVAIPDSVTTIGDSAFGRCDSLKEFTGKLAEDNGRILVIDNEIYAPALAGLTDYTIPNNISSLHKKAFSYQNGLLSITIPSNITSISEKCFSNCENLTSVVMQDGVQSIGSYAFEDCISLESVIIPESVTKVDDYAFARCTSLPVIEDIRYADTILIESTANRWGVREIKPGTRFILAFAFQDCSHMEGIVIPESVSEIGGSAFLGCTRLESIEIPGSVTTINPSTFKNSGLKSVIINSGTTYIRNYAFINTKLQSINIPDSVTTIGYGAFEDCTQLKTIIIPDSVSEISNNAFRVLSSVTRNIYCKSLTPPNLGSMALLTYGSNTIYVPHSAVETYKSATNWSSYADAIVGYDFENNIPVE
jgi:hypothetical protein